MGNLVQKTSPLINLLWQHQITLIFIHYIQKYSENPYLHQVNMRTSVRAYLQHKILLMTHLVNWRILQLCKNLLQSQTIIVHPTLAYLWSIWRAWEYCANSGHCFRGNCPSSIKNPSCVEAGKIIKNSVDPSNSPGTPHIKFFHFFLLWGFIICHLCPKKAKNQKCHFWSKITL